MTYRIIITPQARRDIDAAARWVRENSRSKRVVDRWVLGLQAKIDTLQTRPLRCPRAQDPESFVEEIRESLYGRRSGTYRILFTVRADAVLVLSVRHAARDSPDA